MNDIDKNMSIFISIIILLGSIVAYIGHVFIESYNMTLLGICITLGFSISIPLKLGILDRIC